MTDTHGPTEVQVTRWRDLPSMIVARPAGDSDPSAQTKVLLAPRFQEAIDEAAMRLAATDADDYLEGWSRSGWEPSHHTDPASAAESVAGELEQTWSAEALADYLDALGPSGGSSP